MMNVRVGLGSHYKQRGGSGALFSFLPKAALGLNEGLSCQGYHFRTMAMLHLMLIIFLDFMFLYLIIMISCVFNAMLTFN